MRLTDVNIKKAKPGEKARKLFDGGGLYLQIEPTGGKLWRYKYRFDGKEKSSLLESTLTCHCRKSAKDIRKRGNN